jgi:transcriptional regulator with XRE-family HTH domain
MLSAQTRVNRFGHSLRLRVATFLGDVLSDFGTRLRELRTMRKVSQEALADTAGLHRTYVSSVERGERNISLLNIHKLAQALDVSLRDIMPDGGSKTRRLRR